MAARQGLFVYTDPAQLGETFEDDGRRKSVTHQKPLAREDREAFRMAFSIIPRRELSMVCSHLIWKKGQEEIAREHQVTQGDVSYRIKRARERMVLWGQINQMMKESKLREVLFVELGLSAGDLEVVLGIYRTTSQSVCARTLNLTQGNVRHTFVRVREELSKLDTEGGKRAVEVLTLVANNYNRIRALESQARWKKKFV